MASYDPAAWDELEKLAAERLAQAGTDLAAVRQSIDGMRPGRTEDELHRSAVRVAAVIGGPPPAEDGLRELAHSLGYVLAGEPAQLLEAS
jgi:hypothetical protein